MRKHRLFEGRTFALYGTSPKHSLAKIKAGQLRADGHQARIIAEGNAFGIYWKPETPNHNGRTAKII